MDELSTVNSTSCADLERLAAAAATMGYSSDTVAIPSHQLVDSCINGNDNLHSSSSSPSAVPLQFTESYDLGLSRSRSQHYTTIPVRFSEFQSKLDFDQNRSNPSVSQQSTSLQTHSSARIGAHYAVIERPDQNSIVLPRGHNFGQTVMTTKHISQSNSNIHYIPVETRNIHTNTEALTIAVSQPGSIQIGSSATQISAQPVIHFVPQPTQIQHHSHTVYQQPVAVQQCKEHQPVQSVKEGKEQSEVKVEISRKRNKRSKKKNESHKVNETNDASRTKRNLLVPDPVDINGKKYYVCNICNEKYLRKYLFKRHQIYHTGEKRGALSLETKAEIINRIKSGEKQVDLAMEYNVGRSTLSFIMKNADKFLGVLKNGKFHPDSKRLRGAQREDVEAALYEWYKQASYVGMSVSGPILCRKAKDFATKLGYQEFKATHGWLDRFKHRKHIVLGRNKSTKEKDNEDETDDFKVDFTEIILPNVVMEFDSNDIFHVSEIGLLYRIFPSKASQFKGTRCAGGTNSKKRITVLMCTNMTGSEKFPLLVIGKHAKPKCFKNVKSLPVQYLSNEKSWMTKENFNAWLNDLNSWFVQQNRKILLIVPHLPVHPKAPKLSAVRVLVSPSNFVGPSKLGIAHSLKRNYRRAVLESLVNILEENSKIKKRSKKLPLKLSLLTCLHKLAAAWHSVTDVTISNSFQRSALGKYGLWGINLTSETILGTENLDLLHKLKSYGVKVPNFFTFDDYVTFDDEVQVCHFMDDDDIIASVTGADIESSDSDDDATRETETAEENKENAEEEEVDSLSPSFEEVEGNIAVLKTFIAHHPKGSQEMFGILSHLEYMLQKTTCKQTSNELPAIHKDMTNI